MKALLASVLMFASPLVFAAMPHLSIREIVWDVVIVLGVAIVFGLLGYLIDKAPFIDPPWKQGLRWGLLLVAVLIIIYVILGFLGI